MNLFTGRLRSERGISTLEVIIASALFLVLVMAALATLDSGTRAEDGSRARHEALLDLRAVMTRLTRDVRQATHIAPGCPAIPRCSSASKLDIDTLVGGTTTRVVYEVAGNQITRSVNGSSPIALSDRIATPTPFSYDPIDFLSLPAPVEPRLVRIQLSLTPVKYGQGAITLATDVELRNL